jgi:hypothetical protein
MEERETERERITCAKDEEEKEGRDQQEERGKREPDKGQRERGKKTHNEEKRGKKQKKKEKNNRPNKIHTRAYPHVLLFFFPFLSLHCVCNALERMGKYGEENVNVEPTINPKKKTLCGW